MTEDLFESNAQMTARHLRKLVTRLNSEIITIRSPHRTSREYVENVYTELRSALDHIIFRLEE